MTRVKPDALRGGDAETNADALRKVLEGQAGPLPRRRRCSTPQRHSLSPGAAKDLKAGMALAKKSIDTGEAEGRLDRLIAVSNGA